MGMFGVKAWGVGRYNFSSDLLMDSLIKNDSIDLILMVIQRAADESICGKLSHTNSMSIKCNRNTWWEQHKERRSIQCM